MILRALLLDAYRELNSRRLFWIVLALSAVFVIMYASIGFDETGLFIFFGLKHFDNEMITAGSPMAKLLYRGIFATFIVPIWLAWIATILALISTAPIFPEFVAGGSIDLMLCKPISRLKLFLSKYLASLLFVLLQVTIFCVGVFLAMGWRIDDWEWRVFLAVPLVTLFYSYLYSFCVLIGVWTRSTLAALLLTMLMWFGIFSLSGVEGTVIMIREQMQAQAEFASAGPHRDSLLQTVGRLDPWINRVRTIRWPLPKTSETIDLMDRALSREGDVNLMDLISGRVIAGPDGRPIKTAPERESQLAEDRIMERVQSASTWYIIGTSLLFEALMLAAAAWVFCRRDY